MNGPNVSFQAAFKNSLAEKKSWVGGKSSEQVENKFDLESTNSWVK